MIHWEVSISVAYDLLPQKRARLRSSRKGRILYDPSKPEKVSFGLLVKVFLLDKGITAFPVFAKEALEVCAYVYKRKAKRSIRHYPRGDVDNFCKLIFDSLNGILWYDDDQIISSEIHKRYGPKDIVLLTVRVANSERALELP